MSKVSKRSVMLALVAAFTMQAASPAFAQSDALKNLSESFKLLSEEEMVAQLKLLTKEEKKAVLMNISAALGEDARTLKAAKEAAASGEKIQVILYSSWAISGGASLMYLLGHMISSDHALHDVADNRVQKSQLAAVLAVGLFAGAMYNDISMKVDAKQAEELAKKIDSQLLILNSLGRSMSAAE